MIQDNLISNTLERLNLPDDFPITEELLNNYINIYGSLTSNTPNIGKSSNRIYARKLAGINLLKFKISKGVPKSSIKEGVLYCITNPSWPSHTKLGITYDLNKRLASYQTYSPYRDYRVSSYDFVFDKKLVEKLVLLEFQYSLEKGEWIKDIASESIITYVRKNFIGPLAQ